MITSVSAFTLTVEAQSALDEMLDSQQRLFFEFLLESMVDNDLDSIPHLYKAENKGICHTCFEGLFVAYSIVHDIEERSGLITISHSKIKILWLGPIEDFSQPLLSKLIEYVTGLAGWHNRIE